MEVRPELTGSHPLPHVFFCHFIIIIILHHPCPSSPKAFIIIVLLHLLHATHFFSITLCISLLLHHHDPFPLFPFSHHIFFIKLTPSSASSSSTASSSFLTSSRHSPLPFPLFLSSSCYLISLTGITPAPPPCLSIGKPRRQPIPTGTTTATSFPSPHSVFGRSVFVAAPSCLLLLLLHQPPSSFSFPSLDSPFLSHSSR